MSFTVVFWLWLSVADFLSVLMIRYEKIMLTIMSFTVVFWLWLSVAYFLSVLMKVV